MANPYGGGDAAGLERVVWYDSTAPYDKQLGADALTAAVSGLVATGGLSVGKGDGLACRPVTGMTVSFDPGVVFMNPAFMKSAIYTLHGRITRTVPSAHATLDRIDLYGVHFDNSPASGNPEATIKRIPGTPAAFPSQPDPAGTYPQTADSSFEPLWAIRVPAGASSISAANITAAYTAIYGKQPEAIEAGGNITTTSELAEDAPDNTVVYYISPAPDIDHGANHIFGLYADDTHLYIGGAFPVVGGEQNQVRRFALSDGSRDDAFLIDVDAVFPTKTYSNQFTNALEPTGLAVTSDTVYVSTYRTSGGPDIAAWDKSSGARMTGSDVDSSSSHDQLASFTLGPDGTAYVVYPGNSSFIRSAMLANSLGTPETVISNSYTGGSSIAIAVDDEAIHWCRYNTSGNGAQFYRVLLSNTPVDSIDDYEFPFGGTRSSVSTQIMLRTRAMTIHGTTLYLGTTGGDLYSLDLRGNGVIWQRWQGRWRKAPVQDVNA